MQILQEQISAIHGARTRIRPPRTVEVQVLQEQKPALRLTVSARCFRFMSPGIICGTAVALGVLFLYLEYSSGYID